MNICEHNFLMGKHKLPDTEKPLEKIGIFVDVQNIYYTCRQVYNGNFDYNAFWAMATRNREVVCAHAYATDRGDKKQQEFQNILRAIGFKVELKAVLKRRDGTTKADWDVGIAVDAIKASPAVDVVVLISGDGDYVPLVDYLQNHGNRVEVLAFGKSTSSKLREAADEFIDLGEDSTKYLLKKSRWPAIKIIK